MTDLFTKTGDPAFFRAIDGKPTDWQVRAIAGYTVRTVCDDFAMDPEPLNQHGMSRAHTADEREAWAFGFGWPDRFSASEAAELPAPEAAPEKPEPPA